MQFSFGASWKAAPQNGNHKHKCWFTNTNNHLHTFSGRSCTTNFPPEHNTNTGKQNDQFIFTNRIFQHDSVTTLIFTITSVDGLNNHEIISIRLVAIRMLRENIHSFHAIKWQRYGPALNALLLPRSADFLASWLCFVLTIDSKCWYLMLCKLMRNIFQIAPINRFSRRKFVGISTFWN